MTKFHELNKKTQSYAVHFELIMLNDNVMISLIHGRPLSDSRISGLRTFVCCYFETCINDELLSMDIINFYNCHYTLKIMVMRMKLARMTMMKIMMMTMTVKVD